MSFRSICAIIGEESKPVDETFDSSPHPCLILRTVTREDLDAVTSSWKLDDGSLSRQEAGEKIKLTHARHEKNKPGKLFHLCLAIIPKGTQEFKGGSE